MNATQKYRLKMDITDINTLLQVGERISFECKKCENQIPKSVWETLIHPSQTLLEES